MSTVIRKAAVGDAAQILEFIRALAAFERALFDHARPRMVVLTTPNREYNVRFPNLAAGSFQMVSFVLGSRELSIVDANGQRVVPAGAVELWIGSSQPIGRAGNGMGLSFAISGSSNLAN